MNKYEFKGSDSKWEAVLTQRNDAYLVNAEDGTVCRVLWGDTAAGDTWHHNAHLIAAAPELLQACIDAVESWEDVGIYDGEPYNSIKKVVAKALNLPTV